MKIAYIWTVVFFRVIAVCLALFGFFNTSSTLVIASSAGAGLSLPLMILRLLVVYLLWAIILWLLSAPIAGLIVRDLER